MFVLKLILLQIIIVFIVDCSGVMESIKSTISKFLTKGRITTTSYSLPLIGCSLCMTHWIGLIYLILSSKFAIPLYCLVCMLSFLTPITKDLLFTLRDLLTKLTNIINVK